jgi:hypothetical protein
MTDIFDRSLFSTVDMRENEESQNEQRRGKLYSYSGEVQYYFKYTLPDDNDRLLAFVKVFEYKKIKSEVWPHKVLSAPSKMKVVNVENIVSICGRGDARNDREYVYRVKEKKNRYTSG